LKSEVDRVRYFGKGKRLGLPSQQAFKDKVTLQTLSSFGRIYELMCATSMDAKDRDESFGNIVAAHEVHYSADAPRRSIEKEYSDVLDAFHVSQTKAGKRVHKSITRLDREIPSDGRVIVLSILLACRHLSRENASVEMQALLVARGARTQSFHLNQHMSDLVSRRADELGLNARDVLRIALDGRFESLARALNEIAIECDQLMNAEVNRFQHDMAMRRRKARARKLPPKGAPT
jgi:hypothetical protein